MQFTNDEYKKFTSVITYTPIISSKDCILDLSSYYPQITKAQLKSKPKHILIMSDDIKKLWLVVNTENGNKIRDYVISLDNLFKLYLEYQNEYKSKQLAFKDEKIDRLLTKMDDQTKKIYDQTKKMSDLIGINTEMKETLEDMHERAPRTRDKDIHEYFLIFKLNDPDIKWEYYVVRAQKKSAILKRREILKEYPNAKLSLKIEYSPNAINLYNLIKEKLRVKKKKIRCGRNYIQLINDYTHKEFIHKVRQIEAEHNAVE